MAEETEKEYPEPGTVPKLPQSIFHLENEGKRKRRTVRRFVTRGGELVEVSAPPAKETR